MSQEIKNNIARIEHELADMKAQLAKEEAAAKRPWPARICQGMKFKRQGRIYQVCMNQDSGSSFVLVAMDMDTYYGAKGNIWANEGFGRKDSEAEFEYIPEAKTLVFATGEALVGKLCFVYTNFGENCFARFAVITYFSKESGKYYSKNGESFAKAIPVEALS